MTNLPSVVSRFMEIKGLEAALGIFPLSATRTAVIGSAAAPSSSASMISERISSWQWGVLDAVRHLKTKGDRSIDD